MNDPADPTPNRLLTPGAGCPRHDDIGQRYRLARTVGSDGDTWPILQDTRVTGDMFVPSLPGHSHALAPHELEGPVPEPLERCGHPLARGRRCRVEVSTRGELCDAHAMAAAVDLARWVLGAEEA